MPSDDTSEAGEVLTIDGVAEYLRLGRRSVYRLVQAGELPGRKVLNKWRFYRADVVAWVRGHGPARHDRGDAK